MGLPEHSSKDANFCASKKRACQTSQPSRGDPDPNCREIDFNCPLNVSRDEDIVGVLEKPPAGIQEC